MPTPCICPNCTKNLGIVNCRRFKSIKPAKIVAGGACPFFTARRKKQH